MTDPADEERPAATSNPQLWLFDIDGTLLLSGGAGQAAMLATLEHEFGVNEVQGDIPAAGRTDAAITADLFAAYGIDVDDKIRDRFRDRYITHLERVLPELPGVLLPGVRPLLEELQADPHVRLGLLTGNYHAAARAKLAAFDLLDYFPHRDGQLVGGFGDDFPNRDDVAGVAWTAAASHHNDVAASRTVVIGDTPADVQCGRAIGAHTIAVATGGFDRDMLAACEPDRLVDTLQELVAADRSDMFGPE